MDREKYIQLRGNVALLVYEIYKEKHSTEKNGELLPYQQVALLLSSTGAIHTIYDSIIKEYDAKYELSLLYSKEGNLIKII